MLRRLTLIRTIFEEERRNIYLDDKPITLIQDNLARYLGKAYNGSLTEQEQMKQLEREVKEALKNIDICKLPGR